MGTKGITGKNKQNTAAIMSSWEREKEKKIPGRPMKYEIGYLPMYSKLSG